MEKGFYSWYEDVYNRCAEQGENCLDSAARLNSGQLATSLFTGKLSSPVVVIRMAKAYDFTFTGAWPRSFKAFLYRQQNYHQILHDLYGEYLDPLLVKEHRNLISFLDGQITRERANSNKFLGNKLDLLLRVIMPEAKNAGFPNFINDIISGVFLWPRTYMLILGYDTLRNIGMAGMEVEIVQERVIPLGSGSILFKVAQINCMGKRWLVPVLPDFSELDLLPELLFTLREQVNSMLADLEMTHASKRLTKQLMKS
ncbi:MAG TPA: hypothetical protein VMV56_07965 [Williamwhitmania sp.]|nr:hypothetical protein [Williamwhitmania sp.]